MHLYEYDTFAVHIWRENAKEEAPVAATSTAAAPEGARLIVGRCCWKELP